MKILSVIMAAVCVILVGCTSPESTRNTLETMGFSNITVGGYSFFKCGKDDFSCTSFTATSPGGKSVRGAVGCGLIFKGCTIRL